MADDQPTRDQLEAMSATLEASDDYRVVRRYQRVERYCEPADAGADVKKGVFLDLETTGLDSQTDRIIELALVPFEFTADGRIYRVFGEYDEFEDPGMPIPPEVTALTGITDDMVRGRRIDEDRVREVLSDAAVVVAHNAGFDRPFAEARMADFERFAWACSFRQIPWSEEGVESGKLEYLAYRFGFFYEGHRATIDCLAGIHVLAQRLPKSGERALKTLLDTARRPTHRVWATNSPFETKDLLKKRGYRWNNGDDGRPKSWYVDIDEDGLAEETKFLEAEVYGRSTRIQSNRITAFKRFSDRV